MPAELKLIAFHLPNPIPPEDYEALLRLLTKAEQDRVQRYRLPDDRLRSLISRLAVYFYLLKNSALSPDDPPPVFRSKPRGKPYLYEPSKRPDGTEFELGFNVSHEGRWVLLGVAEQCSGSTETTSTRSAPGDAQSGPGHPLVESRAAEIEIGVDIMVPPPNPSELKEALGPQMTISEKRAMAVSLSSDQLRWTLTTMWTLKEGYTKAIGQGIGFGLDRINVVFVPKPGAACDPSEIRVGGEADGGRGVMRGGLVPERVEVDGRDVVDDGWRWLVGTSGKGMDEIGWAIYARGASLPASTRVEIVDWDELINTFDAVPTAKA